MIVCPNRPAPSNSVAERATIAAPGVGTESRPMRCARCGRWGRRLRAGRGPEGRLVFNWCVECLAEAHLRALGLLSTVETADALPLSKALTGLPISPGVPGREERILGLRSLGALLVVWGLLL